MQHAWGHKLRSFWLEWPFCLFLILWYGIGLCEMCLLLPLLQFLLLLPMLMLPLLLQLLLLLLLIFVTTITVCYCCLYCCCYCCRCAAATTTAVAIAAVPVAKYHLIYRLKDIWRYYFRLTSEPSSEIWKTIILDSAMQNVFPFLHRVEYIE